MSRMEITQYWINQAKKEEIEKQRKILNNVQATVYQNCVKRGYRKGWTAEQFLARQILKMQEELGESSQYFALNSIAIFSSIAHTGKRAQKKFDDGRYGLFGEDFAHPSVVDGFKKELADMQVVLFQMAAMVEEIEGEPFSVVEAALKKSGKDIERGVRGERN